MIETGKACLYLTMPEANRRAPLGMINEPATVSNWPGTLKFDVHAGAIKRGHHNIARTRVDVWFRGPDGFTWHGVNIGDNMICRCKRTKSR